ncbi:MAG: PRC-barrel domain-containing protein [Candidatus Thorarchaeota archaeon]
MDVDKSLNCNELRDCDVIDSTGKKIGKIGDMTFTFDGNLNLAQFVLCGSAWEEFLETIGVRPDKDPLFDASLIRRIGDKVQLTTNVNSLKTTLDEGAIPKGEIRWSELKDKYIVDKDEIRVGKAIDIDIGLKSDIDIIVPAETIESMGDKIKLKVSKDDLKLTMDKALESAEVKKARDDAETRRDVVKVRLYSHRPM